MKRIVYFVCDKNQQVIHVTKKEFKFYESKCTGKIRFCGVPSHISDLDVLKIINHHPAIKLNAGDAWNNGIIQDMMYQGYMRVRDDKTNNSLK